MNSRKGKSNLPRSTKGLSEQQLKEILLKKKQCNTRALRIVEAMCEPIVEKAWLLENLQHINQSHFEDIIEERSISQYCGYPLCTNPLQNVPKQQFKISLSKKAVYDISERKKFCCNVCHRACNFLKSQMLTSPLWFRDAEVIPTFQLCNSSENGESSPNVLNKLNETEKKEDGQPLNISLNENVLSSRVHSFDDKHEENQVSLHRQEKDSKKQIKESSTDTSDNPPNLPDDTKLVQKVEEAIQQWFSIDSLVWIYGEENVKAVLEENKSLLKPILDKQTSHPDFNRLVDLFSIFSMNNENEEQQLKPLPDYSALKADTEKLNIKVRHYFAGNLGMEAEREVKVPDPGSAGTSDGNEVRDFPLVDTHAQNCLRRRIISDRLTRLIPDICNSMGLSDSIDLTDLGDLIRTFKLTAYNVTFKPREWYLITVIIVKLLSLKLPGLRKDLTSGTSKKQTTLLLMSFNLPTTYLDNLMEWLTDINRILVISENSSTN